MKAKKILTLPKIKKEQFDLKKKREEKHQYRLKILQKIEELEKEGKYELIY